VSALKMPVWGSVIPQSAPKLRISPLGHVSCCCHVVARGEASRESQQTFDSWACDIAAQDGDGGADASRPWWTLVQAILALNKACVEECQAWGCWFRIFR
jgi:hypothetical protein